VATTDTRLRILAAAEDVVLTDGVGRLTLDAAAARAGVSKGGVLYHFPSRAALVSAMVAQLVEGFDAALARALAGSGDTPGGYARAYVTETFDPARAADGEQREQAERGERLGAAVLAAMASEPELLAPLREAFDRWQARIEAESVDPVAATIARLAADGLWLSELFGLGRLSPRLREQVRDALIRTLG
jgi:AcrR family transcriptional regulator